LSNQIGHKLGRYKRKYYLNLILRGTLISLLVLLSVFLFFNFVEYNLQSGIVLRTVIFFSYVLLSLFVLYRWLLIHFVHLMVKSRQISDEEAAKKIGGFFPEVRDKLLNLIQLEKQEFHPNSLLAASIDQKSQNLVHVSFEDAVSFRENIRYAKILIIPFLLVAVIGIMSPTLLTEPARRIIQFNKEFIPQAPFQFVVQDQPLIAFKNEDYTLQLDLSGSSLPENVYLNTAGRRVKLNKSNATSFSHNFEKMQQSTEFYLDAAGFKSRNYQIKVVNRPNIRNFDVQLVFPAYLSRNLERISNIGNLQIPEGTQVKWSFKTIDTEKLTISFGDQTTEELQQSENQLFEYEKQLMESTPYTLRLKNEYSDNRDIIQYNVNVIPDEYPKISLDHFQDSILYDFMILGGSISDDYGLSELKIFYTINRQGSSPADEEYSSIDIRIDQSQVSQGYYYQWDLKSFQLDHGESMEYYLQVRDNDGINGRKSTRTGTYTFNVPTREEIRNDLKISTERTENQIDKSLEEARELNERLEDLENQMKGKKQLSWQDQKLLEDLMKQKQALQETIEQLKEQFEADEMKRDRFDKERSQRIKEKVEQLQQLMEELLDEETMKLYEELQKLMEENKDINQLKDLINQLNRKEDNIEKELERTLELFKKIKFENKLQETINDTRELSNKQEELSKETEEKERESSELLEDQKKISEEFEELEKDIEEMQELNQDLQHPQPMQDMSGEQEQIKEQQKQSEEMLEQNKNKKAGKSQQDASEMMKKLADKMESMQSMMMQSSMNLNLSLLRDLLDNLIKLSFSQEELMKDFRAVHQSDPRFLELSQKQLELKDDAKVIQDSLLSLSKQDFRIQSFVTREVDEMNRYLDESVEAIRDRNKGEAVGKQQFAMTSINNLALMLDDVMTQMMNAMGQGAGQPQNQPVPSMTELQQQLNQQINQLKKSGKQGRELSEELAKMAAEQERIRRMLEELEEQLNQENGEKGGEGGGLEDVREKMEQSEWDLVNKNLTDQLIRRQQEILTRLLEAEESQRERELDDEREGEQAKDYERKIPRAFDEYIKSKEQEIELLKTVPPKLNPYYKKEVNDYFKRIGSF